MNRSAGGFVLLLIGALGLIGFLTGQLDRWLAFLFTPPGSSSPPAGAGAPPSSPGTSGIGLVTPQTGARPASSSAGASSGNQRSG